MIIFREAINGPRWIMKRNGAVYTCRYNFLNDGTISPYRYVITRTLIKNGRKIRGSTRKRVLPKAMDYLALHSIFETYTYADLFKMRNDELDLLLVDYNLGRYDL